MSQIKNLINRTAVSSDPESDVKASEDFLLLFLCAHVVAAARQLLLLGHTGSVTDLAKSVVATFGNFKLNGDSNNPKVIDGIHLYACEAITLGLLWYGFYDATKEGDGERVLTYWKYMLVLFKTTNHHNYSKEATKLLLQCYYTLSERKVAQIKWSRFVNTKGRPGCNMPCDLYMEHLNRRIKTVLRNMGSNINPNSITRAGKSVGIVHKICQVFEEETKASKTTDYHPIPTFAKDFESILNVLEDEKVMLPLGERYHPSFKFKCGLLQKLCVTELIKRLKKNIE